MAESCLFCRIGVGEIESEILYRDDTCFVIRDIAPRSPVHLLVVPIRHFTRLAGLSADDYPMLGGMFSAARKMAEQEGVSGSGYRLVINQGNDAGQQVDHLHLHLLAGRPLGGMG
jgi:histidine triad (HIT) family protein